MATARIPGGYYLTASGQPVNAEGEPVKKLPDPEPVPDPKDEEITGLQARLAKLEAALAEKAAPKPAPKARAKATAKAQ